MRNVSGAGAQPYKLPLSTARALCLHACIQRKRDARRERDTRRERATATRTTSRTADPKKIKKKAGRYSSEENALPQRFTCILLGATNIGISGARRPSRELGGGGFGGHGGRDMQAGPTVHMSTLERDKHRTSTT